MSAQGLSSRAAGLVESLQSAWHWWIGELALLVPQNIRDRLDSGVAIIAIDLETDAVTLRRFAGGTVSEIARLPRAGFDAASLRAALAPYLSRRLRDSFALRLPDASALARSLSLPLAARRNIASMLDIELERQSPIDRAEIYHDYRILRIDRAAGRIDIVWRLVRRRGVDPALAICREAGIDLAVIAFIGDETPPDGGNFPVVPRAARLLRLRRQAVRGLLLAILLLLGAVTAGVYARNQDAADEFHARVDAARLMARPSLRLEHQIAGVRQRAQLLLAERQRPIVASLLAETTRILPDGSWLTDFTYRDGEVRIQGYSNAAPSLIALFDASPLFASAQFRAPLTQAQNREQEQFDLSFKLRKGAP